MERVPNILAALGVFEMDALDDLARRFDACVDRVMTPENSGWQGLRRDPAMGPAQATTSY